jgi:hypothetical protein
LNLPLDKNRANENRPRGIVIVAILTILFGLAEVKSGLTHNFMGLTTSPANISTELGVSLGVFYFVASLLILIGKKWTATLAVILLVVDVIGRLVMVIAGFYALSSFLQTFAIVIGTSLAAFFAIYIGMHRKFLIDRSFLRAPMPFTVKR